MIQLLSLAMFATVLVVAIMTIIATVKAELPYIARALGVAHVGQPGRVVGADHRSAVSAPARVRWTASQQ